MQGENNSNHRDLFNTILYIAFLVFMIYAVIIISYMIYHGDFESKDITPFVILGTSVIAGGVIVVRLYVNNQISIKEKEMSIYLRDAFKEMQEKNERQWSQLTDANAKQWSAFTDRIAQFEGKNTKILDEISTLNEKLVTVLNKAEKQMREEK